MTQVDSAASEAPTQKQAAASVKPELEAAQSVPPESTQEPDLSNFAAISLSNLFIHLTNKGDIFTIKRADPYGNNDIRDAILFKEGDDGNTPLNIGDNTSLAVCFKEKALNVLYMDKKEKVCILIRISSYASSLLKDIQAIIFRCRTPKVKLPWTLA